MNRNADFSPQEPRTDQRVWSFRLRPTSPRSCELKSAFRVRFMAGAQVRKGQEAFFEPRQTSPSRRQILVRPHFLMSQTAVRFMIPTRAQEQSEVPVNRRTDRGRPRPLWTIRARRGGLKAHSGQDARAPFPSENPRGRRASEAMAPHGTALLRHLIELRLQPPADRFARL